jgi:hypothetical protein
LVRKVSSFASAVVFYRLLILLYLFVGKKWKISIDIYYHLCYDIDEMQQHLKNAANSSLKRQLIKAKSKQI